MAIYFRKITLVAVLRAGWNGRSEDHLEGIAMVQAGYEKSDFHICEDREEGRNLSNLRNGRF